MRESFTRSEELLDLEMSKEDPILDQKQELQNTIQNATPDELGSMLEMIQVLNIGKTGQARR